MTMTSSTSLKRAPSSTSLKRAPSSTTSTMHLHRPRLPRGYHMKTGKVKKVPAWITLVVTAPYRAEHKTKKTSWVGVWRLAIEDAMQDAREKGVGARVVSSEGVLLAKFDNAYSKEASSSRVAFLEGSKR